MSEEESPFGSATSRRRLNDGSALSIQSSDVSDGDEDRASLSSQSRSLGGTSQRLFGDGERPYEIDSHLTYDARGPAPLPDISLAEADDRLACLELQLDGTPGKRYRGAAKAGMACWLCQLPVYKRNPEWKDVAVALAVNTPASSEDTTGFQMGHLEVKAYIMSLRTALQSHAGGTDRLRQLEELEVRADEVAADLAGMYRIMQVSFGFWSCLHLCVVLPLLTEITPRNDVLLQTGSVFGASICLPYSKLVADAKLQVSKR